MKTAKTKSSSTHRTPQSKSVEPQAAKDTPVIEQHLLNALLENIPDYVYFKDTESRFIRTSQAHAKMFGLAHPADVVGKRDFDFFSEEHARQAYEDEQEIIRTGQSISKEEKETWPDRPPTWVLTTKMPLRDEKGKIIGTFGISKDVTARKQAEDALLASEKRFRALVEHSLEEISLVSADGTLIYESPNTQRPLGYPPNSFVGRNLFDLFHPDDRAVAAQLLGKTLAEPGSNHQGLFRLQHQDGSWRWMEGILTNLLDEPAVRAIVVNYRDVTQRQDAEEELKHRLSDFQAIDRLSSVMRQAQTSDELLPIVLDVTLDVLGAPIGGIWLYHPARAELRLAVMRGYTSPSLPPEKPSRSISGYVFATGEPFIERDFHTSLRLPEVVRAQIPPGTGGAVVPIRAGDHIIGTLNISVPQPRELTPDEVHLLVTLSEIAGNAIQRAILYEQTERRLQHLAALSKIDRSIISSFDLRFSLGTVLTQVAKELEIDAADVYLINPHSKTLEYAAGHGFRDKAVEKFPTALSEGYAGRAIMGGRTIHIPNLQEQPDDSRRKALFASEAFVGYYAVPLIAKGQVKGVLEVFRRGPFDPDEEWLDFLDTLAGQAAIAIDNATLFDGLQRSNMELSLAYDATIEGWSHALDLRDKETEGHTQRVTDMTIKLARSFGVSEAELAQIRWGALLHDIGKMGVPDAILLKPGPLTDEEWVQMRKHPSFAYEMLSPIQYLHAALDIPYCHHEKWDGSGYPRGLKGEQISLAARIFAIVDVWDALTSDRPYRSAWPTEKVRAHIQSLAGTHFDPEVLKVCLESGVLKGPKGG